MCLHLQLRSKLDTNPFLFCAWFWVDANETLTGLRSIIWLPIIVTTLPASSSRENVTKPKPLEIPTMKNVLVTVSIDIMLFNNNYPKILTLNILPVSWSLTIVTFFTIPNWEKYTCKWGSDNEGGIPPTYIFPGPSEFVFAFLRKFNDCVNPAPWGSILLALIAGLVDLFS